MKKARLACAAGALLLCAAPAAAVRSVPGPPLWVQRYDGPKSGDDGGAAIAVAAGRVLVTGTSVGVNTLKAFAPSPYAPATGETLWKRPYDGTGQGDDQAQALAASP